MLVQLVRQILNHLFGQIAKLNMPGGNEIASKDKNPDSRQCRALLELEGQ